MGEELIPLILRNFNNYRFVTVILFKKKSSHLLTINHCYIGCMIKCDLKYENIGYVMIKNSSIFRTVSEEDLTKVKSNFQRSNALGGRSSLRASVRGEMYRSSMLQRSVRSRRSTRSTQADSNV